MHLTLHLLLPTLLLLTTTVLSAPITPPTTLDSSTSQLATLLSSLDETKLASLISTLDSTKLATLLELELGPTPVNKADDDEDGDDEDEGKDAKLSFSWVTKGIDKIKDIFKPKPKVDKWAQPNTSFMSWSRR